VAIQAISLQYSLLKGWCILDLSWRKATPLARALVHAFPIWPDSGFRLSSSSASNISSGNMSLLHTPVKVAFGYQNSFRLCGRPAYLTLKGPGSLSLIWICVPSILATLGTPDAPLHYGPSGRSGQWVYSQEVLEISSDTAIYSFR